MDVTKLDVRECEIAVLLNRSSGSCDADSAAKVENILKQAGVHPISVECVEGSQLNEALEKITEPDPTILVVLGGDGTIRAAAERCAERNIILLPLPGGTMNMLPTALYGKTEWPAVLSAVFADPHILEVSGGEVEGHRFFCAAIFGTPTLLNRAREAVRANLLFDAIQWLSDVCGRAFSRTLSYEFGETAQADATAVAVVCPLVSACLPADQPALEAAALDVETALAALRLALNATFSDWRLDPSVVTSRVPSAKIRSRREIPGILDGEAVLLPREIETRFVPMGFRALVPGGSLARFPGGKLDSAEYDQNDDDQ